MNPETQPSSIQFGARHLLSVFVIASLMLFSVFAALDLETANKVTSSLRDGVLSHFDWLFNWTASLVLITVMLLVFHPAASRKMGQDDEKPEFGYLAWFAMLFSAGLASGLIYWGTAEPITHFGGNPFLAMDEIDPGSRAAATRAITITVFHWGLHGWGFYVLAGLAIGLSAYRYNHPLSFSSALIPLLGEQRINGKTGTLIDLLALYGTVFGVATSIGLAVASMNATIEPLIDLKMSLYNQIGIVVFVCTLGVFSVVSGVAKGIRRLSEVNLWISAALLLAILLLGPTGYLLASLPQNLIDYGLSVIPMGFWTASQPDNQSWQGSWTVFYWGWWLAWTPFVALFVARISRGRTVREFILGVLFVPCLVVLLWMSVLGGTALHQELAVTDAVSAAVAQDYSLGMVATIRNLGYPEITLLLLAVVSFLLFTWLITSLDSATLVICHILHVDHLNSMKVFWGFVLGAVTCTLMLIGGVSALQAASIIIGLPLAVIVLMLIISVLKQLSVQEV